jgi:hypothetical protein
MLHDPEYERANTGDCDDDAQYAADYKGGSFQHRVRASNPRPCNGVRNAGALLLEFSTKWRTEPLPHANGANSHWRNSISLCAVFDNENVTAAKLKSKILRKCCIYWLKLQPPPAESDQVVSRTAFVVHMYISWNNFWHALGPVTAT